jgi:hypothetical protein
MANLVTDLANKRGAIKLGRTIIVARLRLKEECSCRFRNTFQVTALAFQHFSGGVIVFGIANAYSSLAPLFCGRHSCKQKTLLCVVVPCGSRNFLMGVAEFAVAAKNSPHTTWCRAYRCKKKKKKA